MQSENIQTKRNRSQVNWKKIAAQAGMTFAQGALFAAGGILVNRMATIGTSGGASVDSSSNVVPLRKQANG